MIFPRAVANFNTGKYVFRVSSQVDTARDAQGLLGPIFAAPKGGWAYRQERCSESLLALRN